MSLEYHGAFSADPVQIPDNEFQLDVRTFDAGFIYLSTAQDALSGT